MTNLEKATAVRDSIRGKPDGARADLETLDGRRRDKVLATLAEESNDFKSELRELNHTWL